MPNPTQKLDVRLLGSPQIFLGGEAVHQFVTRKAQALLIYVAGSGQAHTRDALAGFFWRDISDAKAKNNLRRVLPNLRKLVGSHLSIDRQQLALDPSSSYFIDAQRFQQALSSVRGETQPNDATINVLEDALQLYRGEYLAGFHVRDAPAFEEWVLIQREYYRELAIQGFTALAAAHLGNAHYEAGLAATNRILALEPWCETAHFQQMLLLARSGQRTAALAQYELCRTMLAEEFDTQPTAAMIELYEQLQADALPGAREMTVTAPQAAIPAPDASPPPQVDWGEMPRPSLFVGRQNEMHSLSQWIVDERCTLVTILGAGGTGKTTLASAFIRVLAGVENSTDAIGMDGEQPPFTHIVWRSLLNAPPLATIVRGWLHRLIGSRLSRMPDTLDEQISLLFEYLQQERCLLVLDNVESILLEGAYAGQLRTGYEAYGMLLRRMGEMRHQSCLLLTSREMPLDIGRMDRDYSDIRTLRLRGLPVESGVDVIRAAGLDDAAADVAGLVERYSGNPLALKLVAETIREIYAGDIAAFLQGDTPLFDDIRTVLNQQFERLSALEREVLAWLAVEREPVAPNALLRNWAHRPGGQQMTAALRSLQRRSLVEQNSATETTEGRARLTLQNVVMEYMTGRLIDAMHHELTQRLMDLEHMEGVYNLLQSWFNRYALVKAQSTEYVRSAQKRMLLQPLLHQVQSKLGPDGTLHHLRTVLEQLHNAPPRSPGYAAANLLHLLLQMETDLTTWDFSNLIIRQAELRHAELRGLNVAGSDLTESTFLDTFSAVLSVAFTADGSRFAAATTRGEITIWQADTLQPQQVCQAGVAWIRAVAFSPQGDLIAAASVDHCVYLFDTATGRLLETLRAHSAEVRSVVFSPDGRTLASGGMDGAICLWDVDRCQLRQTLLHHTDFVMAVAFSPDGSLLVSGGGDRVIRLWHVAEGGECDHLEGHTAAVTALAFSGNGRTLVSTGTDQNVCLWDVEHLQALRILHGHSAGVESVALHPQGRMVATGCQNGEVRLWNMVTGECWRVIPAHGATVWALTFSPDGERLVSGSNDYTIRVWDPQSGAALQTLRGYNDQLWGIGHIAGTRHIVSCSGNGELRMWDVETGALIRRWHSHDGVARALAVSPDGDLLASGGADCAIRLWDATTEQLIRTIAGHAQRIFGLSFSPDGRLLASCSGDGIICLWHSRTGRLQQTLHAHQGRASAIAFSPNGRLLASGGYDRKVYLWHLQEDGTLQKERTLDYQAGFVYQVAFSPNGQTIVVASNTTPDVHLWDVQTGECVGTLQGAHEVSVDCALFSPNGTLLATAGVDQDICVWDAQGGQLLQRLSGHTAAVRALLWLDGETLLSCSGDETIRFWELQSGTCVCTLRAAGPYAGMDISGATGLSTAQREALLALGAHDS